MADFPESGENFRVLGPWCIESGQCWLDWRVAAMEATIRAARHQGDSLAERRLQGELRRLRAFDAAHSPAGGRSSEANNPTP